MNKKAVLFTFVLLLTAMYVGAWYTDSARKILRYQPTGLSSNFTFPLTMPFTDYITKTTNMIRLAREKTHVDHSEQVVLDNSPLQLFPNSLSCQKNANGKYKNGILLVHGFTDSPYSQRALAHYFQNKCFVVYTILLPGHGTVPGDLTQVTYQDWAKVVKYGVYQLSNHVDNIYLSGFSLGALLSIHTALTQPSSIKALILFSPLLKIYKESSWMIKLGYWITRWIPGFQWLSQREDNATVLYESIPWHAVYQIQLLIDQVSEQLAKQPLTLPVFIMQSAEDATVSASATLKFFESDKNPSSHLLWFSEKGVLPSNTTDPRITGIKSYLSKEHILNMAHTSMTVPASDPIYGIKGSYRDCLAYQEHTEKWNICKSGMNTYLGETTPENLREHIVQRLTFNPFFDYSVQQITLFLGEYR